MPGVPHVAPGKHRRHKTKQTKMEKDRERAIQTTCE